MLKQLFLPLNIFLSLYFVFKLCFFDFHVILQQKVARHGVYRKSLTFIVNMIVNFIIYDSGRTCFKLNNYVLDKYTPNSLWGSFKVHLNTCI